MWGLRMLERVLRHRSRGGGALAKASGAGEDVLEAEVGGTEGERKGSGGRL